MATTDPFTEGTKYRLLDDPTIEAIYHGNGLGFVLDANGAPQHHVPVTFGEFERWQLESEIPPGQEGSRIIDLEEQVKKQGKYIVKLEGEIKKFYDSQAGLARDMSENQKKLYDGQAALARDMSENQKALDDRLKKLEKEPKGK